MLDWARGPLLHHRDPLFVLQLPFLVEHGFGSIPRLFGLLLLVKLNSFLGVGRFHKVVSIGEVDAVWILEVVPFICGGCVSHNS